jgi:serine/threonine protein kinase/Tol biopolymer transport system component
MSLAPGTMLGPYRVESRIGAGGMGEVYKAIDTRLDRTVAVKTANGPFSDRFLGEAKAIASLNHPHICTLHDVGPDYLVMEYIIGKLLKGPLPLDEALRLAGQIADALDAAHRKGLVHRDLKPANILVAKNGAKLLDFGLARTIARATGADDVTLTAAGIIAGTVPYMAPEQLEGKAADTRSDIFAFGCVLYEMITGRRAFIGDTQASVIGAIMSVERPSLPDTAPPVLDRIIRRCLAKDPEERWQTARDLREALDLATPSARVTSAPSKHWPIGLVAGVFVLFAGVLAFKTLRTTTEPSLQQVRFQVPAPAGALNMVDPVLSPDGTQLAFRALANGEYASWIRPLDSLISRPAPGVGSSMPQCWSPDGRFLLVRSRGKLVKIDVIRGLIQSLAGDQLGLWRSADWSAEGIILAPLAPGRGIQRISSNGSSSIPATQVDAALHVLHDDPQFFPDGRRFLYTAVGRKPEDTQLRVGSLDLPPEAPPLATLKNWPSSTPARILFGSHSQLIFRRDDVLTIQRIDEATLRLIGDPVPIPGSGSNNFTISRTGSGAIAFSSESRPIRRLGWHGRDGKLLESIGDPRPFLRAALSPDGKSIVASVISGPPQNLWKFDLVRGTTSRFTFTDGWDFDPVWSPDSRWVAYRSKRPGQPVQFYRKLADGAGGPESFPVPSRNAFLYHWSPDGRFLLVSPYDQDLWMLPFGGNGKDFPFVDTPAIENGGRFSPDSRWIAYLSDESGRVEIYVRDFSGGPALSKGKWQVSSGGGASVRWSGDGRELYYASGRNVVAVPVLPSADEFRTGTPRTLFEMPPGSSFQGPAPDGSRFLIATPTGEATAEPITVILNWQASLK